MHKQATKLPWDCKRVNDGQVAFRISAAGLIIADVLFHETNQNIAPTKDAALENANLIVSAVNSHASLMAVAEAAKKIDDGIEKLPSDELECEIYNELKLLREALAKLQ